MKNENVDLSVLPDAVRKQHEEAAAQKAEMEARRENASKPAPAAVAPTPAPAGQAAPDGTQVAPTELQPSVEPVASEAQSGETVAHLEAKIAEYKRRIDNFHGEYGGNLERLRSENAELRRQLDEEKAKPSSTGVVVESAQPAQPATVVDDGKPDYLKHVSDEDLERYGEDYFKTNAQVAKGVLEGTHAKIDAIAKEAAEAKAHSEKLADDLAAEKFWGEVEQIAPGARVVNGDPDRDISSAPGWGNFLDEPVRPGSPLTRRMEAESAIMRDTSAFAALVKEFQGRSTESNVNNGPPKPSVQSQAVPVSVLADGSADTNLQEDAATRQIPQSEIDAFYANSGKGTMTPDEADAKMNEYTAAIATGRVLAGV